MSDHRVIQPTPQNNVLGWAALVLLVVITASVYMTTLGYPLVWDDELFFSKSSGLAEPSGIIRAFAVDYWGLVDDAAVDGTSPYYRPIALAFIALERVIFGTQTAAFRFVHAGVHLVNVVLLFVVVRRLLSRNSQIAPAVAAAVLAAMPYTVDTVLFLASICDLLVMMFSMLAVRAFLVWSDRPTPAKLMMIAIFTFAAMLSKENAVVLPLVFFVLHLSRTGSASWRTICPPLALSGLAILGCLVLRAFIVSSPDVNSLLEFGRLLPANVAIAVRYAVFPVPLVLEHGVLSAVGDMYWVIGCLLLGISVAVFVFFRHRLNMALAGIAIWLAMVMPSLVAIAWTEVFAPRYLYLPVFGLSLIIGHLVSLQKRWLLGVCVSFVLVCTLLTIARSVAWKDGVTLWAEEITYQPESISGLINLGNLLARNGDNQQAVALQLKAAKLAAQKNKPCRAAYAYTNAAHLMDEKDSHLPARMELYVKGTQLCPAHAQKAWMGIARIYLERGLLEDADSALVEGFASGPRTPEILVLFAGLRAVQGQERKSIELLEEAQSIAGWEHSNRLKIEKKIESVKALRNRAKSIQ
jgi:dolichyl-phosphate-mannose-protein mannosyltransferase/tetratricopeptide repeat protein